MRTLANVTYPSSGIVGQQMSLFLLRSVRVVSFSYGCGTQERSGVGGECAIQESVRQSRTARLVANVRHGELIGARPWKSAFPQTEGEERIALTLAIEYKRTRAAEKRTEIPLQAQGDGRREKETERERERKRKRKKERERERKRASARERERKRARERGRKR